TGQLDTLPVQGNVHLLAGGGSNVVVQVGQSGAIIIDARSGTWPERMLAEIKRLTPVNKPVRYILNTSADADHVGGNESLTKRLRSGHTSSILSARAALH